MKEVDRPCCHESVALHVCIITTIEGEPKVTWGGLAYRVICISSVRLESFEKLGNSEHVKDMYVRNLFLNCVNVTHKIRENRAISNHDTLTVYYDIVPPCWGNFTAMKLSFTILYLSKPVPLIFLLECRVFRTSS